MSTENKPRRSRVKVPGTEIANKSINVEGGLSAIPSTSGAVKIENATKTVEELAAKTDLGKRESNAENSFLTPSATSIAAVRSNYMCFCGAPFDQPCPCDKKLMSIATAIEKKYLNENKKK